MQGPDYGPPLEGLWQLARRAGAPWMRVVMLTEGWHVITRDVGNARVSDEVRAFAARLADQDLA